MLLAILLVMALTADTRASLAASGGADGIAADPAKRTPFDRHGMWIWYVDRSEGGSIDRIVARARQAGIGTLYIKSGDGDDTWSQFNKALVGALHRGGLDVCAWQFVYGDQPVDEAKVGAAAVRRGADCLVIDAEGAYQGKYAAADRYVRTLRARIGAAFPLSLAAFPYVDYHPSFPYSVFFGPGGATANQPQMYWRAIGTSVRAVYEHTFLFNRLWGHPLYPLGQTYGGANRREIVRFRRLAHNYGGLAPSWWDWQETTSAGWGALGAPIDGPVTGYEPVTDHPLLKRGSSGDLVVWAQAHLRAAIAPQLPVTGIFGKQTRAAVRDFQASAGLLVDGRIGTDTWRSLLDFDPVRPRWAGRRAKRGGGALTSRALPARRPLSASLLAVAYEIPPGPAP
ncbi:MAG TPA: peptidoglycan-binding domain-containing protein [Solirubrobacterales bacterium]